MKKILLTLSVIFAVNSQAQNTLFEDGFETYTNFAITGFGNWQTLDLDQLDTYTGGLPTTPPPTYWTNAGDPQAYIIFNPSAAGVTNAATAPTPADEVRNFDPHGGSKYAAAWNAVPSTTGGPVANNDWLISPPIQLGLTGNSVSFWVKSLSNTYGLEQYKVGVYVGSGSPTAASNFTVISGASALSAPYPAWEQKNFQLDAYAGQTVRIGIQCVSADHYMFMVDDFKVTALTLGTSEADNKSKKIFISPNPTSDLLNIKTDSKIDAVSVVDISGRKINVKLEGNTVDVRSLPIGTYIINIETKDGITAEKFIKK